MGLPASDVNDRDIHDCAVRIIKAVADQYPDMHAYDAMTAMFGALLITARQAGVDDHGLHESFGIFLEDNAA